MMMITSLPIKKSLLPHLIILAFVVASCGSYQTSYGDGIYEDVVVQRQRNRKVPAQQPRTVNTPNNNQTYKNYFSSKAKQSDPSNRASDIFTDIDSYSSSTPNGERNENAPKKTNHPGWGGQVSDLYIDSSPAYQTNAISWGLTGGYLLANNAYGGFWDAPGWAGWNNPNPWNYGRYGWNNWGWNNWNNNWGWNSWNNWGWNSGFYGPVSPFWGFGNGWINNGFYCPAPYYGNAYVGSAVAYVTNRSRRGFNSRMPRNYTSGNTASVYPSSRRVYGKSNYSSTLLSTKSRNRVTTPRQSRRNANANTSNYTIPRNVTQRTRSSINRNSNYDATRRSTSNTFNRNSNNIINRRSSSSNSTFRSSSSSSRSSRSTLSRSSSVRSSSGSRRGGGRQ